MKIYLLLAWVFFVALSFIWSKEGLINTVIKVSLFLMFVFGLLCWLSVVGVVATGNVKLF